MMFRVDYNSEEPEEVERNWFLTLWRSFLRDERYRPLRQVLTVLFLGLFGASLLIFFADTPPKIEAPKVATPVVVTTVKPISKPVSISGFGTVTPRYDLSLRPQVSGSVVAVHPLFQQGGRIAKDVLLFQIDKRDYEIALEEQRASLERAALELQLEEGNQIVAKREWELLNDKSSPSPLGESLALRKPHLKEKQAAVEAAKGRVKKAELDLERTQVRAPFPLVVIEESIEQGKFITPQEVVGQVVSTEEFDIEVQLLRSDLKWLSSLYTSEDGEISAQVIQRVEDGSTYTREGKVVRLLGDVDPAGRMAKVLIRVANPLSTESADELPILLGTYVEVRIQGSLVEGVYQIPQRAVREGGRVWIVSADNTLQTVEVERVFGDAQSLYVRGNLGPEAQVITNSLPNGLEGTRVRILDDKPEVKG